ncbi:MAG TPA: patatin-like phospholipase family protein [Nitrospiria bacterium]|nr:patatin-like phospholipase family protein [Nitrospiria bacterium]HUK57276.1 patatin-like phospholipase family protein [Nitrospiria bacterium]
MARIGIALSGGAARCIAHLGVLDVLVNAGIPIRVVAGTSGGSVAGAFYASGRYTVEEMIRRVSRLNWWHVTQPVISRQGLFSSDRIGRFMHRFLGNLTFDQLEIPLAVVATEISTGKKVVIREGSVVKAVQASCSLPVIFKPTAYEGRLLVDGGFVSQIPVLAVREELAADFVIAVDVNFGGMDEKGPPRNMIQIATRMASLWARKNAEEEGRKADFLLSVNVSGIGLTDLGRSRELLQRGRQAAEASLANLHRQLEEKGLTGRR